MAIANSSQKTHIATFVTQPFMVDALHDSSFKYDINNNNSKLEDYSIEV
jgi:hypothetical protein